MKQLMISFVITLFFGLFTFSSKPIISEIVIPEIPKMESHILEKLKWDNSHKLCSFYKECLKLAEVGYYEARGEDDNSVLAVMKVVLNRVYHERYPSTVTEVVNQGCQFSYRCDKSLKKAEQSEEQWNRMKRLSYLLLTGRIDVDLKGSTHYHNHKVKPFWSKKFVMTKVVGGHKFYRCTGYC